MKQTLIPMLVLTMMTCAAPGENWPAFRGPSGQGDSMETNLPLFWGAGSNILWNTAIPGQGWSSPIVWNSQVFVTTVTDDGFSCRVLSLDRRTGRVLWNREVFQQKPRRKETKNSYATPTPVCDGHRVYALFGDGSFAALGLDGATIWTNRQLQFYSRHGLGASPILHQGLIILPVDWSNPVDAPGQYPKVSDEERLGWQLPWDRSFVMALETGTGREVWRTKRGLSRIAHATPRIWEAQGRTELISAAGDVVQGFDPATGQLLWTARSKGEGVVPSVVLGDSLAFTASGFESPTIRAVRPGGQGDVTQSHLAWEQKRGTPSMASFAYVGPHLYAVTDGGMVTCLKASTGEIAWQERIGGTHSSSPVVAGDRVYFLSESGETTVIPAQGDFRVLARNTLGEKCQASMAASQGNLFIRTERHLFCIGP